VRYERAEVRRTRAPVLSERGDEPLVKVAVAGVVVLFLVFYIVNSPDNAASMAHSAGHLVSHVAHGIGNFLDKLAS
jgi:hypothetical protein